MFHDEGKLNFAVDMIDDVDDDLFTEFLFYEEYWMQYVLNSIKIWTMPYHYFLFHDFLMFL